MERYKILDTLKERYKDKIYKKGVYKISFVGSDKFYIGIATRDNKFNCGKGFYNRWSRHLRQLENGKHCNRFLKRVFEKEGIKNIVFEILEELNTVEECIDKEVEYFQKLKPQMNFILNKRKPYRHFYTEEERRIRSEKQRGRRHTKETKKNMSVSAIGNSRSSKKINIEDLKKSVVEILLHGGSIKGECVKLSISRATYIKNVKKYFNYTEIVEASRKTQSSKLKIRNKQTKNK